MDVSRTLEEILNVGKSDKTEMRQASASILGFEYQLRMTASRVLDAIENQQLHKMKIEGIEDLDIYDGKDTELCQYKYYEGTSCSASTFQKAIAYFYCHWYQQSNFLRSTYKYRLFAHSKNEFSGYDTPCELYKTLSFPEAKKILNNRHVSFDKRQVLTFSESFKFIRSQSYDELTKTSEVRLATALQVKPTMSEALYYPWLLTKITNIAVQKNDNDRIIDPGALLLELNENKISIGRVFYGNSLQENQLCNVIVNKINNVYLKTDAKPNFVLVFGSIWKEKDIVSLVELLTESFAFKGRKSVNMPLTFSLDTGQFLIDKLKKQILKSTSYMINDGFESIDFQPDRFVRPPVFSSKNKNVYQMVSYNLRVVKMDNLAKAYSGLGDAVALFFDCHDHPFIADKYVELDSFDVELITKLVKKLER